MRNFLKEGITFL